MLERWRTAGHWRRRVRRCRVSSRIPYGRRRRRGRKRRRQRAGLVDRSRFHRRRRRHRFLTGRSQRLLKYRLAALPDERGPSTERRRGRRQGCRRRGRLRRRTGRSGRDLAPRGRRLRGRFGLHRRRSRRLGLLLCRRHGDGRRPCGLRRLRPGFEVSVGHGGRLHDVSSPAWLIASRRIVLVDITRRLVFVPRLERGCSGRRRCRWTASVCCRSVIWRSQSFEFCRQFGLYICQREYNDRLQRLQIISTPATDVGLRPTRIVLRDWW